jgi:Xaa-Pro dipeptidase
MTIGVGGSTSEQELAGLVDRASRVPPITPALRRARIARALGLMGAHGIDAMLLPAGSSLFYFTGLRWGQSERLTAALLLATGELHYICPVFEVETLVDAAPVKGAIHGWQEHENPYELAARILTSAGRGADVVALDEATPFFIAEGLRAALPGTQLVNAVAITRECRMRKSAEEISLLSAAKQITLEVQRRAARILRPGITAGEVSSFINDAHVRLGGGKSTFCLVFFGEATANPHGISGEQVLREGDMVLIDTGCDVQGYKSDITRTYVFGEPTRRQREIWDLEKAAQAAAFEAARIGVACEEVDRAARRVLETAGFGPGYALPGLPHRTGHGIGLDLHEWTYLVEGNRQPLEPGMCFSNEPMICIHGEFGVRLEDHFYMSESGPVWFTEPAHSCDAPFGDGRSGIT